MNTWLILLLSIAAEVLGTISMKLGEGFKKPIWVVCMVLAYLCCFGLLTLVVEKLPVGLVYAIWSGLGVVLVTVAGVILFAEQVSVLKILGIIAIIGGIVLVELSGDAKI